MSTVKLGLEAKMLISTDGAQAASWQELKIIKDVTLTIESKEADVSSRAGGGWEAVMEAMKSGAIEFEILNDPDNAQFQAVRDAYFNKTPLGIACVSHNGGEGLLADMAVLKFSRSEPLQEAQTYSVSLKPTYSAFTPTWGTATAAA